MIVYDYKIIVRSSRQELFRIDDKMSFVHGVGPKMTFTPGYFRIYCNCCMRGLKVFIVDERILNFWGDGSWECKDLKATRSMIRYFTGSNYCGEYLSNIHCKCNATLLRYLRGGDIGGGSHTQEYTLRMTPC